MPAFVGVQFLKKDQEVLEVNRVVILTGCEA